MTMPTSHWHQIYRARVGAPPSAVFELLADLTKYPIWLPASSEYAATTEVEPYPVRLGSRYHDGRPAEPGKDWWGTVTGYQPPGALDFHHTITVAILRAHVDVHIHYSFEAASDAPGSTDLARWLLLSVDMPVPLRPLRRLLISRFDAENVRTLAAVVDHFAAAGPASS